MSPYPAARPPRFRTVRPDERLAEARELVRRGGLTSREIEVLVLVAEGLTNKEIAARLYVAPCTVSQHVRNLLYALSARNRAHAVTIGIRRGLLNIATPTHEQEVAP